MQASTKEGGTLRKLKNIEILETIEAATSLVDLSKSLDEIYSRNSILFPCFKDFKINDKQFKGPVWFLSKDSISALTEFVNSIQFNLLVSSLHSLSVLLISKHSKCSSSHLNDAIGCMVLIQLISKLYSGILFISVENNLRSCCQELCLQFNSTLADPTTSNCILWILEQQNVTKKSIGKTEFFNHPGGIGCWFDFYFPLLIVPETDKKSFQIASVSQTASLDYISLVTSSLSTLGHSTKVIVPKITVKHFLDLVKSATSKSILVTRENENRFATIANDILENLKRRLIDVEFTSGDFATVLGLVKDERIAMFCAWMVEKDVSSLSLDLVVSWRKLYLDFEQETEIVLNLLVKEGGFTRESPKYLQFLQHIEENTSNKQLYNTTIKLQLKIAPKKQKQTFTQTLTNWITRLLVIYFTFVCLKISCENGSCLSDHPIVKSGIQYAETYRPILTSLETKGTELFNHGYTQATNLYKLHGESIYKSRIDPIMKSKINPLLSDLSNSEGFKYLEKAASKLVGNFDRNVHRAAIFLVLKVIPLLKEYSLKTQEFIMVKIYPIVIDGLSQLKVVFKTKVLPFLDNLLQLFYQGFTYLSNEINEFYKKFILPTIISTISRITNSEYYKAFINSGFVKDLVDLYGKFLKSSFAIQVYELFLVWFDGYLFLRNGVVCGVYGVDCDGVVEVYEAFKKLF